MEWHARVKRLYLACSALEGAARERLLERECGADAGLRAEVEAMLDFDRRRPGFLQAGPLDTREHDAASAPRTVGRFRVRREIGAGGMGSVLEVEQDRPPRVAALKLLRADVVRPDALCRFQLEAEILGRLQHPSIARIFESGQVETDLGPRPFLLMELVGGVPLTHHACERQLDTRARLELLTRVCDAVQHAHQNGVIHRDLKPANILVDDSGAVKVLDFGIARLVDDDLRTTTLRTGEGQIVGTLAYMSPEQASGDPAAIDVRSDVYSLGVLLYELLADRLPYDVSSHHLPEAVRAVQETEPRRLSGIRPRLRGDVETIVLKALAKEKDRRYASAAALAADIRHFLRDEPIDARPASRTYTLRKFVRRNRILVACTAAVVLALSVGLVSSIRSARAEERQRERAERMAQEALDRAYQSGMLAAQLAYEAGNWHAALTLLEAQPEERRGWEWDALRSLLDRSLGELAVPDLFDAAWLDRERVLAVDEHGVGRVWDPVLGTTTPPEPIAPGARPLALSSDGQRLVSFASGELIATPTLGDGPVLRIPLASGEPAPVSESPWQRAKSAVLAPAGNRLALVTADPALYLVDLAARADHGTRIRRLSEDAADARNLRFSPDGRLLAATVPEGVRLWDAERGELRWSRRKKGTKFHALAFDLERGLLVTAHDAGIHFHRLEDGARVSSWEGQELGTLHLHAAYRLDFDPRGAHLAALFRNGSIRVLEAGTGSHRVTVDRKAGHMRSEIAYAPDGATLLTVDHADDTLRLWNAATEPSFVLEESANAIYPLVISPDGARLATAGWDGNTRLQDAVTGEELAVLHSGDRIWALAFAPDSRALASGMRGRGLVVWDSRSGELRARLPEIRAASVAYSPDGARLAAGGTQGELWLLDAASLAVLSLRTLGEKRLDAVAWSPDGRWLAAGSEAGFVALLDSDAGTERARFEAPAGGSEGYRGVQALAFSPDGRCLASGWGGSELILLEPPDLAPRRVLIGHAAEVFALAYAPDGSRLASGGRDGILRLWDPTSGALLFAARGHRSYVYSLAFTPDGRRIATGSGDGTVRLWDSAPGVSGWRERAVAVRAAAAAGPAKPLYASGD